MQMLGEREEYRGRERKRKRGRRRGGGRERGREGEGMKEEEREKKRGGRGEGEREEERGGGEGGGGGGRGRGGHERTEQQGSHPQAKERCLKETHTTKTLLVLDFQPPLIAKSAQVGTFVISAPAEPYTYSRTRWEFSHPLLVVSWLQNNHKALSFALSLCREEQQTGGQSREKGEFSSVHASLSYRGHREQ